MEVRQGAFTQASDAAPSSVGRRLARIAAEFVGLAVVIALVPFIIYLDTSVLADSMSEQSLTEYLHNVMLFLSIMAFGIGAWRLAAARGYLVSVTTLFLCMFIREYDVVFDRISQGFWFFPALGVLGLGVVLAVRNRRTFALPLLRHFETRQATFIYIGMLLLLIFTRLFGTGSLWEAVMGADYSPAYKAAIQEGLELMSYFFIAYGSWISYLDGFGQARR